MCVSEPPVFCAKCSIDLKPAISVLRPANKGFWLLLSICAAAVIASSKPTVWPFIFGVASPNFCPKKAMLLAQVLLLGVMSSHSKPHAGQV